MKKVLGTAMHSPKMEIISMLGCMKTVGWLGTVAGRQYFKLSRYAIRPKLLRRELGLERDYYIKSD